jgi:bacterioferritin
MSGRPEVSGELLDMLNDAVAREIQVSVQYMWQHVLWSGVQGYAVKDAFRSIAIAEMKHAEAIAERLSYFDAVPTTKPTPIFVGTTLQEMLERDKADEEGAMDLYRRIVQRAGDEGDVVTQDLFKAILADEEDHHDTFISLLEGI